MSGTDKVEVYVESLHRVSRDADDAAQTLHDVLSALNQGVAHYEGSSVWGDDDPGHEFADGPHGYRATAHSLRSTLAAYAKQWEQISKATAGAADETAKTESDSAESFRA